jgi:hypothetical protein
MTSVSSLTITPSVFAGPAEKSSVRFVVGTIVSIIMVDLATGWTSWYIVQPGDSLFGPTTLAVAIVGFAAFAWSLSLKRRLSPSIQRRLWPWMVILCLLAPLWAYFGVLQVSLRLDTSATRTAQELIASKSTTCNIVTVGSVGVLRAPYEVCAKHYSGYGYRVNFTTLDERRGYAYIRGRSDVSWFPNQCAKHLFGDWWVFNTSVNTASTSCPMGYPENGAG